MGNARVTGDFAEGTRIAKPVRGIRTRAIRHHVLEIVRGPGSGTRLSLDGDKMTLGRTAAVDLQLESEEVSRSHCQLTRMDDEYTVEDLQSRNGIYLNGLMVHAAVLRDGDELQVGDVVLVYHEGT